MDKFVDIRDFNLLSKDKYTFFILNKIIKFECRVLLSDHEKLIICHTGNPFPVWVWTPDDASEEDLERAYRKVLEVLPPSEGYTYNLKYELADYIIKREAEEGRKIKVQTNMFAYDCPEPIHPENKCDGELHQCTEEDLDELVDFFELFHNEIGIDKQSREEYRINAKDCVDHGSIYLWKNAEGKSVASCNWKPGNEEMASIGLVYTRDEARRKHYAENLVYEVTKVTEKAGFLPMLYTNADYVASNACYEKIGYKLRGKLCSITLEKDMILRPYKSCDAEKIVSWIGDAVSFHKWSSDRFGEYPITAEDINQKYLECNGDCEEPDNFYPLTATIDGEPVGHLILRYIKADRTNIRFGFVIVDSSKRGKGYGKKMLQKAIEYAFNTLNAKQITLGVFDNNPQAHYCYLAAGFKDSETRGPFYQELLGETWKCIEMEIFK